MQYLSAIATDPDVQGGVPCFVGTRVPVRSLFDAIKHGRSIDYFLEQFPSVQRTQVNEVLDEVDRMLTIGGQLREDPS